MDVVGGASAGGINGALLAAAIYSARPLPNLRETWIGIGDFTRLLRPPSKPNPPSLLQGDEVVLAELQRTFNEIYVGAEGRTRPKHSLYAYLTGTDFSGREAVFSDSSGRTFAETDHRATFCFEYERREKPVIVADKQLGVMRDLIKLAAPDAAALLAHAARATASFPVAFEPHGIRVMVKGQPEAHWFIDGGVLDNQPFNPVLDRIAMVPAGLPVRRIVAYVVPYVTDPTASTQKPRSTEEPPAADGSNQSSTERSFGDESAPKPPAVLNATGSFPRDLPKFVSLERVSRDWQHQHDAEELRKRLQAMPGLPGLAQVLFATYRQSRYENALNIYRAWVSVNFKPGRGAIGQDEALDPVGVIGLNQHQSWSQLSPDDSLSWIPDESDLAWTPGEPWNWGLGPSERIVALTLGALRGQLNEIPIENTQERRSYAYARLHASSILRKIRESKAELYERFSALLSGQSAETVDETTLRETATTAYADLNLSERLTRWLSHLDEKLSSLSETVGRPVPRVEIFLQMETVQNALSVESQAVPAPFVFLHMSAGIDNALGHLARTPAEKVVGTQLNHFAGFFKRSWRANDWLWGRLDGTQHLMRALLDRDYLRKLIQADRSVAVKLAEIAFPNGIYSRALKNSWQATLARNKIGPLDQGRPLKYQFTSLLEAASVIPDNESYAARELARQQLECCRDALAARVQLDILKEEIPRVAAAVNEDLYAGASRSAPSVEWARRILPFEPGTRRPETATPPKLPVERLLELVDDFTSLDMARETPAGEMSSRLGLSVASQTVAVASALASGNRSGLPAPIKGALSSVRAVTVVLAGFVRLIANAPRFGLAALVLLVGTIVWGLVDSPALLGAALPVLVIVAVLLLFVVLTLVASPLEGKLRTPSRAISFAAALGGSVYLGLAGWFSWPPLHGWLQKQLLPGPLRATGLLFFGAAAILLLSRVWQRAKAIWWFRLVILGALGTSAGAFTYHRYIDGATCPKDAKGTQLSSWACVADEHHGTILILSLLAASGAAALLADYVATISSWLRTQWQQTQPLGLQRAKTVDELSTLIGDTGDVRREKAATSLAIDYWFIAFYFTVFLGLAIAVAFRNTPWSITVAAAAAAAALASAACDVLENRRTSRALQTPLAKTAQSLLTAMRLATTAKWSFVAITFALLSGLFWGDRPTPDTAFAIIFAFTAAFGLIAAAVPGTPTRLPLVGRRIAFRHTRILCRLARHVRPWLLENRDRRPARHAPTGSAVAIR